MCSEWKLLNNDNDHDMNNDNDNGNRNDNDKIHDVCAMSIKSTITLITRKYTGKTVWDR